LYYIIYFFLYLISLLPFRVLYLFSTSLFFIFYKILGYRKKVTWENLSLSFPEKSTEELKKIMDAFYLNLCDSIVETIKLLSITEKELEKRMKVNWQELDKAYLNNRKAQVYMSHQFNWEWGTVLANWKMQDRFTGIYLPLSNKIFDKLMIKIRSRSGTQLIPIQEFNSQLKDIQQQKITWGFIADQNPSDPKRVSWNSFLGRITAFAKGAEFVARRYNNMVFFGETIKLKRGYYEIKLKLAFETPKETLDGEITEAYVHFLEESIKSQPQNWVWSHRRWKHKPPTS
jgi:KDO2-lipid IV(A) lauroyltransferase